MRIFLFLLTLILAIPMAYARTEGIAAVVNQDAISMTDLNDRLRLVIASSGIKPSPEIQDKITSQVLSELVDEQLKIQEAQREEITVSEQEVQEGFAMIAGQNNLTIEQFAGAMKSDGINPATLERQIRAQIGWSKVIQKVMRPQVTVSDNDVDDYISRLKGSSGKSEYRVSEIFLPVGEGRPEADAQQLAHKLVNEIQSGKVPFGKVAQQFSAAAGAERGGNIGWVQQGQLAPELDQALSTMQKDGISQPIRTQDGYHILQLRELRTISEASLPSREQVYSTIGIQRLEKMQERHLMELRSTAFIENRVQS
jgi:peptidyl-prolyl cis-trans isomerase SurA